MNHPSQKPAQRHAAGTIAWQPSHFSHRSIL